MDESGWDIRALEEREHEVFALQILDSVIKFRWGSLPLEQREGIKNFYIELGDQFVRGRTVISEGKSVRDED